LVAALAGGASVTDAATIAGISRRTAHRRLQRESFQKRVKCARDAVLSSAADQLRAHLVVAVAVLGHTLHDPDARVRLAAATAVARQFRELDKYAHLEARVRLLEEAAAGRTDDGD
jgi:hypothetical protein